MSIKCGDSIGIVRYSDTFVSSPVTLSFDLVLWTFGPKINHRPRRFVIILCSKFGDPRFNLSTFFLSSIPLQCWCNDTYRLISWKDLVMYTVKGADIRLCTVLNHKTLDCCKSVAQLIWIKQKKWFAGCQEWNIFVHLLLWTRIITLLHVVGCCFFPS